MEIRTAEFCRRGHPDRVCDLIADALLDEFLKNDPESRVALEVFGSHGLLVIGGEVTSKAKVDITKTARNIYRGIGYKDKIKIEVNIKRQSKEIKSLADLGAGDSGVVIGYATNETPEMLPIEVVLAKQIVEELDNLDWLLPDGKVQVILKDGKLNKLIVSVQGKKEIERRLRAFLKRKYPKARIFLNVFQIGGFSADTGLTGRKNVLWYGPRIPIGGGSFAGKDATKIDRSGAYWARSLAIKEVRSGIHKEALIEIAFAIGQDDAIYCKVNDREISTVKVSQIIEKLRLQRPIFKVASLNGHFGYLGCPWEENQ